MCVVHLRGCERGEGDVWYAGGVTVMCGMWEVVTVMCMGEELGQCVVCREG